jgi:hypothetical protein
MKRLIWNDFGSIPSLMIGSSEILRLALLTGLREIPLTVLLTNSIGKLS